MKNSEKIFCLPPLAFAQVFPPLSLSFISFTTVYIVSSCSNHTCVCKYNRRLWCWISLQPKYRYISGVAHIFSNIQWILIIYLLALVMCLIHTTQKPPKSNSTKKKLGIGILYMMLWLAMGKQKLCWLFYECLREKWSKPLFWVYWKSYWDYKVCWIWYDLTLLKLGLHIIHKRM